MNQNHKLIYVCIPLRELFQHKYAKINLINEHIQKEGGTAFFSCDDPHGERLPYCDELWVYAKYARQPDSNTIDFATARALIVSSMYEIPVKYFYKAFTPQTIEDCVNRIKEGEREHETSPENSSFLDSH